jgi:hypothetical protein
LCEEYENEYEDCNGCPFAKFRPDRAYGCLLWIKEVDNIFDVNVNWDNSKGVKEYADMKTVRRFRKRAKELITWV